MADDERKLDDLEEQVESQARIVDDLRRETDLATDTAEGLLEQIAANAAATAALAIEERRRADAEEQVVQFMQRATQSQMRQEQEQRNLNLLVGEQLAFFRDDVIPSIERLLAVVEQFLQQVPLTAAIGEHNDQMVEVTEANGRAIRSILEFLYLSIPILTRKAGEQLATREVLLAAATELERPRRNRELEQLDTENKESLRRQLLALERRLRQGEEQLAKLGAFPPLEKLAEVEELREKVEFIKRKLDG